eukprot:TRINITY_DN8057_c0_g1_i2.p1 TRINITY_DN8057_c0_g1~~TRINITY_DN8057_c0_g1_i2.p1  ORF type:complete len:228 (-),score=64.01 TRINITY_DN8057_c0_g1_i2:39-722(-)
MAQINVVLAQMAEKAERYDEMADFMEAHVKEGHVLAELERDLFSAAFKNALNGRRHAARVAVSVASQEESTGQGANAALAMGYKSRVENELLGICTKALSLLEQNLLPTAQADDQKVFYLKMTGDYYRYMSEFSQSDTLQTSLEKAAAAYSQGMEEAAKLAPANPIRLGLALNYSVFQHENWQDTENAIRTAHQTLELASNDPGERGQDAELTMQLLQENLQLWASH